MSRSADLLLILLIAGLTAFSFWGLSRHDVVTDEASYMVRGMRLIDFNFGIQQSTPIQWVESVPWWMRLSFHDHPPLVFFLENVSCAVFGESVLAGRIPSAAAGLVSVLFVFLIGSSLYSQSAGVAGAALFGVTVGHVWISRLALQEQVVILLMLAASYFFIRGLRVRKLLVLAGAFAGLAMLAKYTAAILLPIFLTVLLVRRRDYFLTREFLYAVLIFIFAVSPIVIYNAGLYFTFGHFDFQFSYVFGQSVGAWQEMPGKEAIGSLGDRIFSYLPTLFKTNSPLFLALSFAGLLVMARHFSLNRVFFLFFAWLAAFMLVVGPTERFLTMLVPWFAIATGVFLSTVLLQHTNILKYVGMLFIAAVVFFELFYSYNSAIALVPAGKPGWAYAEYVRRDLHNWGYNQMEDFIREELYGKRPDPAVSFEYPVIARLLDRVVSSETAKGFEPKAWMIIYNGNQAMAAQLWTFLRRGVYHGWPVADAETYRRILAEKGGGYFKLLGIEKIYFIQNTERVLLREVRTRLLTHDGDILESELLEKGVVPRNINNLRGEVAFKVYEFAP